MQPPRNTNQSSARIAPLPNISLCQRWLRRVPCSIASRSEPWRPALASPPGAPSEGTRRTPMLPPAERITNALPPVSRDRRNERRSGAQPNRRRGGHSGPIPHGAAPAFKDRRRRAARYSDRMCGLTFFLAALALSASSPTPDAPTCARWARFASAQDRVCYEQTRKNIVQACLGLQVELRTTRCLEGECSPLSRCPASNASSPSGALFANPSAPIRSRTSSPQSMSISERTAAAPSRPAWRPPVPDRTPGQAQ